MFYLMCGIIGVIGDSKAFDIVVNGLDIIKNRGKDAFGIYDFSKIKANKKLSLISKSKSDNVLGHCLHSIVSYIPQPIEYKKTFLSVNCEIYNWKELALKYNIDAKNDSEMLIKYLYLKKDIVKALEEIDGVYSFSYIRDDKLYLARDIFGVKPLWFSQLNEAFYFCSEKKALESQGIVGIEELNPRQIIEYDLKKKKLDKKNRSFFLISPEHKKKYDIIKKELKGLLASSISKRIPDQKVGILFSGGVDSTIIALICQELEIDFVCYTSALVDGNMHEPSDLKYSKEIARKYGFKLKVNEINLKDAEKYISKVAPLIEDNTVVKVGVALTFYAACKFAKKDNVRVIFSGLGSEEIFAGYERHKNSSNINKECLSGLLKIYERDLYRDDVITMNNNIELRLPFLDKALVSYALKIPGKYKLNNLGDKIVLREIAEEFGLEHDYAFRKKVAAQYGSKFSRAIEKLSKKNGYKLQSKYLAQFYKKPNVKIGALVSGGKDGMFAAYLMDVHNYSIECFISIRSKNQDSYMYHTPNIEMVEFQAKACDIPLIIEDTVGDKEKELLALKKALRKAKEEFGIEGIVSGAIFSNYQRERIDKICEELGLKNFVPLWHMDQELEMRQILKNNFSILLSSVAGDGLDKSWLGREIKSKDIDNLVSLSKKIGLNIAGEGGEFESLVLDCPLFKKRIDIKESRIEMEGECCGRFNISKAELVSKN